MDKPMTFIEWCASKGVIPYSLGIEAAYEAGQQSQQSKVEELQRRNQMLNDNIKEQGQKLVYQNEVIETQAEKLLGLRDEKAELQKRVDAALKETQYALQYVEGDMRGNHEFQQMSMIRTFKALEQVLNGGEPK
ncbi:hypothetical protein K008_3864 [Acinetobacter baumannii 25569_2]|uniref:hypothetical protein n=1 Tax=Acinetobacter baumannii TaxID=470 RepID=UPI0004453F79|nr:hypothetical protein [Acinetobacter baumannii]EMC9749908.1 hypothetical protein [Acinetobacter baumannii]EXC47368.1 hypothetical protein J470_3848 [Acinetobacter baumannii 1032241]EXE82283.1 hypothetical protein J590_3360 [Acinetobacter baumannii 42887]EYD36529.1 hypothetical protein J919_4009 [Acinetobacter baumannii 25493_6]EYR84789.1 hypothetical protein K040_3804 [Acinetobacter baumannii 45052_1]